MDQTTMLRAAAVLFGLTAVGGLVLAIIRFRGVPRPPLVLAMGHGVIAAAGLTLLVYSALMGSVPLPAQIAALVFVLAATGGMAMNLMYHSKGLALPIPFVIVHGLAAAVGFGLLLSSL